MISRKNETGSAHVVIIVVLVLVIVGLLGFVFWQNFIQKKPADKVSTNTTSVQKSVAKVDPASETKTYTNKTLGFSLDYPSSWTLNEKKGDQLVVGTLTSPTNLQNSSPDSPTVDVTIQAEPKAGYSSGSNSGAVLAINGNAVEYASMKYNETINSLQVTEYNMNAQSPYFAVLFPVNDNYVELDFNKAATKADMTSELTKILHSFKAL